VARLRAWSRGRQLLGGAAPDPLAALRRIVGAYSAHPSGPLTIAARTPNLDGAGFAALEVEKRAVRLVGMRGSSFLVPIDAADALLTIYAMPMDGQAGALRARGLDAATYRALKPHILEAAQEPISPAQLRRALGADPKDEQSYFAMRLMGREGLVLRVGTGRVRSDDLRWVATEAWLGRPLGHADRVGALAWLAEAYLAGHGPARVADFAWWAGLPVAQARSAVEAVKTVEVLPGHLLPAGLADDWHGVAELDDAALDVLPKWDAYTMGFAPDGRARLIDDAHLELAYSTRETRIGATTGDGNPLVLEGGRAVASWRHRLAGRQMTVTIAPFEAPRRAPRAFLERCEAAFRPIGELMEATVDVQLETG